MKILKASFATKVNWAKWANSGEVNPKVKMVAIASKFMAARVLELG